jgi:hypothetical protein
VAGVLEVCQIRSEGSQFTVSLNKIVSRSFVASQLGRRVTEIQDEQIPCPSSNQNRKRRRGLASLLHSCEPCPQRTPRQNDQKIGCMWS